MIRFALRCTDGHEFEGWFRSGSAFEAQRESGEVACPQCGDTGVQKALMAPNIARSRDRHPPISPAQLRSALVELRHQVETHCDYVGDRFAEEARRIHYGEVDPHGIYGEASHEEARELYDEGIEVSRIPWISHGDA